MQNRSDVLVELARDFIEELDINVCCAYAGGSVGRGKADDYSDLDLMVYTDSFINTKNIDTLYKGEIIQLDLLDIRKIPTEQQILQSPWEHRFLSEISIIKDHNGLLSDTINIATNYFNSDAGRKKMLEQVSYIVKERIGFAKDCLEENRLYSANIGSMGAWAEACFLYLFLNHNSLSTGSLIPMLEKLNGHIERFKNVSPFSLQGLLPDISIILSNFRKYLREQGYIHSDLAEIHDTLCDRKIQRLLTNKERLNVQWQMYGEAVGLYFATSKGLSLEQYLQGLPRSLKNGLYQLGFAPLDRNKVNELCSLSEEILALY